MIGRKTRNAFNWPSLGLKANPERCIACGTCTSNCPMSIDVQKRVKKNDLEDADCILCGQCADNCKQHVISYTFSRGRDPGSAET
jgi:ferredoxin-type protein NapH